MTKSEVNSSLFYVKAHYFLYYAGLAPVLLFLPTYLRHLGFSSIAVGSMYTILPLLSILSKLILANIADRFQCHKLLLLLCVTSAAILLFIVQYVPPIERKILSEIKCDSRGSSLKICSPETREDHCLLSKLKNEPRIGTSIYCTMECSGSIGFVQEICYVLQNGPQFCKESTDNVSALDSFKYVSAFENVLKQETRSQQNSVKLTSSKNIKLDAYLKTDKIFKVNQCFSFTLEKLSDGQSGGDDSLYEPFCNSLRYSQCRMVCNSSVMMNTGEADGEEGFHFNDQYSMLLIVLSAGWFAMGAINCLGDSICYNLLGDNPEQYGKQRFWGSLGWGGMATVSGLLVDFFSKNKAEKDYTSIFYCALFFFLLDVLSISLIKKKHNIPEKKSSKIASDVGKILFNFRVVIFILWIAAMGFFSSMISNFLFWHLEDLADCKDQEWIKTLQGLYITIACFCGEFPFFFINSILLEKLGHRNIMVLVLFMFGIMHLTFSVLETPWLFLPVGIIGGFIYSTFYSCMTSYANIISTPSTKAFIQGIFSSAYEGLGGMSGNFTAGSLIYYMERRMVFRLYCCMAFISCFLLMFSHHFVGKNDNKQIDIATVQDKNCKKGEFKTSSCYVISA